MSDEQEIKLACLHQAGGNLDHAKDLFAWVSGRDAPSPDADFESGFYCGLKDSPTCPGTPSGMRGWKHGDALRKRVSELEARLRTRGEDGEGVSDHADAIQRSETISALTPPLQHKGGETEAVDSAELSFDRTVYPQDDLPTEDDVRGILAADVEDSRHTYGCLIDPCTCDPVEQRTGGVRLPASTGGGSGEWVGTPGYKIVEGFVPWDGESESGPATLSDDSEVEYISHLAGGEVRRALVCELYWGLRDAEDVLDIIAYRPISSSEADSGLRSEAIAGDARIEQTTAQPVRHIGNVSNDLSNAIAAANSARDQAVRDRPISTLQASSGEGETIPEGFTAWTGSASEGPIYDVGSLEYVEVLRRSGSRFMGQRQAFNWEPQSAIIAYRVLDTPKDESIVGVNRSHDADETPTEPAAYSPVNNADEPFIDDTVAGSFARGKDREIELAAEVDAVEQVKTAEAKRFGSIFNFGKPKALVGEGA